MMTTTVRPIDLFLDKVGYQGSRNGGNHKCTCPAHDDDRESLSVKEGDDGKVLVKCFAECRTEDVVARVGLKMSDLMPIKEKARRPSGKLGPIVATYDYVDEQGVLLCQATRHEPKDFRQRQPDGKDNWIPSITNPPVRRVPYRLPELMASDPAAWVYVVEGEKDVDNLVGVGAIATCNAMGAGKWQPEYSKFLAGRRVCILPDNDEAGRKHAHQVAGSLIGVAAEVRMVELPGLPEKGDVSDWLAAGGTVEKLMQLIEATPAYIAPIPTTQTYTNGNGYHAEPDDHGENNHASGFSPLGDVFAAPPLPASAKLTAEQAQQASSVGGWFKQYLRFATEASPMTPVLFHLCAAIIALSIAVARRIYLPVGTRKIYPNLYILYVGPSTTQRKTEGMNVLEGLLQAAGMEDAFLLPERVTPEALIENLSLNIPQTFKKWSQDAQSAWLAQRSLPAQRGWLLDEASHLLDSFNRDYTAGMLPLVLDLYDSKGRGGGRLTKSYGLELIKNAYITIFGATTFAAMAEHMGKAVHWGNGLFARFTLVASDEHPAWQFWPEPLDYPEPLVRDLNFIVRSLFGDLPEASFATDKNGDAYIVHSGLEERPVDLSEEARAAWERYAKAVAHDMLTGDLVDERLHASYGRLSTMLIKVAMLGAVADAKTLPICVDAKHIWWAQGIVEAWREGLHKVITKGRGTEMRSKADEVRNVLARLRDLVRKLACTVSDIEETLEDLIKEGEIEKQEHTNRNGTKSVLYRLIQQETAI